MSDRTFMRLIAAVCIIGLISAAALTVYTFLLYRDCSIISYIANRG